MNYEIKQVRLNLHMTQEEFSKMLCVPIKTLRNWEQGIRRPSAWMVGMIIDKALQYQREKGIVKDENHGILSFQEIQFRVAEVARNYEIDKVILFGSYAKGEASEESDVDLFMESNLDGLAYFGVAEEFREALIKRVDVLSPKTVVPDSTVDREIKETGVTIYER